MKVKYLFIIMFFLFVSIEAIAAQKRYDVPIGDSPTRGPADAPVTIVEFIDYQ